MSLGALHLADPKSSPRSPITPFCNATTVRIVIDRIRESDYELACEIIHEPLPPPINVALIID